VRAAETYDYAVIRVVPRVERGEFLNAGIVLSCASARYLAARVALDAARLRALDPEVDLDTVHRHLQALVDVCAGNPAAGPIAALPQRARFHWLTAPRSALIQTSPVHAGRCSDPQAALAHLLQRMVLLPGRAQPDSTR
jgi:hypothetical protein